MVVVVITFPCFMVYVLSFYYIINSLYQSLAIGYVAVDFQAVIVFHNFSFNMIVLCMWRIKFFLLFLLFFFFLFLFLLLAARTTSESNSRIRLSISLMFFQSTA